MPRFNSLNSKLLGGQIASTAFLSPQLLIVGGGGGGGANGGGSGGAGGLLYYAASNCGFKTANGTFAFVVGTSYTVSVGYGGGGAYFAVNDDGHGRFAALQGARAGK
jgi:hypothetical protein